MTNKDILNTIKRQYQDSMFSWCKQFNNRSLKILNEESTIYEGKIKHAQPNLPNFSVDFTFEDNTKISVVAGDANDFMFTD